MKEMYTFEDRGGDSVTLRPEGTAGVCRALVTNGLTQSLPQKVFYAGPMFRYERPQKGRYRQFHQIGAELIGAAEPLADAEVIACGWDILKALGIAGDVVLELNTLGDRGEPRRLSRRAGRRISPHTAPRCPRTAGTGWSATRCASSTPRTRATAASSPARRPSHAHLTAEARGVLRPAAGPAWPGFGVPFVENPRIVRGLDYYSHTAFEFVTTAAGRAGHGDGGRPL